MKKFKRKSLRHSGPKRRKTDFKLPTHMQNAWLMRKKIRQILDVSSELDGKHKPKGDKAINHTIQRSGLTYQRSLGAERRSLPKKPRENKEVIQAKSSTNEPMTPNERLNKDLRTLESGGRPLPAAERAFFEPRFGTDFSDVNVHSDGRAAKLAKAINARAFALGSNVVFAKGQYAPGTHTGRNLLGHELTHVVQQRGVKRLQRQVKPPTTPAKKAKKDVVVIVGRPSQTLPKNETAQEKEKMRTWRSAARALSPHVFEGLTVDKAFAGLKSFPHAIGKLYIIGHADSSGVGEVARDGSSVVTTPTNLSKRIRGATGVLGRRKPDSVAILACYGGGSPKTMGTIGSALGAASITAPVQETVISGTVINVTSGGRTTVLTKKRIAGIKDSTLITYIKQTDALKYYDFVPGVPHPKTAPSEKAKLSALLKVLRNTGMIPYVGYNAAPGKRYAVPYWKANVVQKKVTDKLTSLDRMGMNGLIEVKITTVKSP